MELIHSYVLYHFKISFRVFMNFMGQHLKYLVNIGRLRHSVKMNLSTEAIFFSSWQELIVASNFYSSDSPTVCLLIRIQRAVSHYAVWTQLLFFIWWVLFSHQKNSCFFFVLCVDDINKFWTYLQAHSLQTLWRKEKNSSWRRKHTPCGRLLFLPCLLLVVAEIHCGGPVVLKFCCWTWGNWYDTCLWRKLE